MSTLNRRAFAPGASLAAIATVPAAAQCVPFPTLAEVNAPSDHELLMLRPLLLQAHGAIVEATG